MNNLKTLLSTLRAYVEVKNKPGYYLDHSRWHRHVPGLPDDHPIRSKRLHDLLDGNDRWTLSVHPHPHYRGSHQVLVQPRHVPEGVVRSVDSDGRPQFHDPAYMELAPAIIGGPDRHRLVPRPGVHTGYLYDKRPGHIYRGMNTEEAASIKTSGRVQSREEYNLGGPQEGHTYFADSLDGAMSYGSGYAPRHLQPTFDHPGFTVEMRLPEDARTDPTAIQGEVGVHGGLDRSHITRAWMGHVVGMTSGTTDLYYEPYSGPGEYKDSGRNLPDSTVVWKELAPHEIDHHFGTSLAGRSYAIRLGPPPPTHRTEVGEQLRLAPSRVNPEVERWQRWGASAQVPAHRQAWAARLKDQVSAQLDPYGPTWAQVHAHATANLPQDDMAANLGVQPHHVADGVMRVRAFAPALIDHLYAGSNSDAALERLSHLRLDLGMQGGVQDANYTGTQGGGARGAALKYHPWHMGLEVAPAGRAEGGTTSPESTFAHELAHALDQQRTLAHIPVNGPVHDPLSFLRSLRGATLGQGGHADAFASPLQFGDLHEALHAQSRAYVPRERQHAHPDVRVASKLPEALARLHYPTGGTDHFDPYHKPGHHGTEWVTTLTESAINHPPALRALDGMLPEGAAPLADRLKDFWGFDFPGAERARTDTPESAALGEQLAQWRRSAAPVGRGVPSFGHEHVVAHYDKKW